MHEMTYFCDSCGTGYESEPEITVLGVTGSRKRFATAFEARTWCDSCLLKALTLADLQKHVPPLNPQPDPEPA